jgi:hypothetical protein
VPNLQHLAANSRSSFIRAQRRTEADLMNQVAKFRN